MTSGDDCLDNPLHGSTGSDAVHRKARFVQETREILSRSLIPLLFQRHEQGESFDARKLSILARDDRLGYALTDQEDRVSRHGLAAVAQDLHALGVIPVVQDLLQKVSVSTLWNRHKKIARDKLERVFMR